MPLDRPHGFNNWVYRLPDETLTEFLNRAGTNLRGNAGTRVWVPSPILDGEMTSAHRHLREGTDGNPHIEELRAAAGNYGLPVPGEPFIFRRTFDPDEHPKFRTIKGIKYVLFSSMDSHCAKIQPQNFRSYTSERLEDGTCCYWYYKRVRPLPLVPRRRLLPGANTDDMGDEELAEGV